ncbi:hypothetical protein [Streptomyces sp. CBMA152]|uniref:TlpA family protein disulfide reductase n=1 Tax=Streptomyces sp. CBMA152 TaxID=1896312 RepID=UPI001660A004|nr:hypothetical protein [Streptomyces sp. CBMA152]MBD0746627.1 hypothetical protein [Streptomyces sp. CBMA152]
MPVLTAAVVVLTVLCLLNLTITLGVVRRLREQSAQRPGHDEETPESGRLQPGTEIAEFSVSATDGTVLSRAGLEDTTLIGVFSPECPPCVDAVPEFVAYARAMSGGRERALARVLAKGEAGAGMVDQLLDVAAVVKGADADTVMAALAARALPTVYLVDRHGKVLASGSRATRLPLPSAV